MFVNQIGIRHAGIYNGITHLPLAYDQQFMMDVAKKRWYVTIYGPDDFQYGEELSVICMQAMMRVIPLFYTKGLDAYVALRKVFEYANAHLLVYKKEHNIPSHLGCGAGVIVVDEFNMTTIATSGYASFFMSKEEKPIEFFLGGCKSVVMETLELRRIREQYYLGVNENYGFAASVTFKLEGGEFIFCCGFDEGRNYLDFLSKYDLVYDEIYSIDDMGTRIYLDTRRNTRRRMLMSLKTSFRNCADFGVDSYEHPFWDRNAQPRDRGDDDLPNDVCFDSNAPEDLYGAKIMDLLKKETDLKKQDLVQEQPKPLPPFYIFSGVFIFLLLLILLGSVTRG